MSRFSLVCSNGAVYLLQLENAKQTAVKNSDFASSTREELAGTKLRLESQSLQINNLHKQVEI